MNKSKVRLQGLKNDHDELRRTYDVAKRGASSEEIEEAKQGLKRVEKQKQALFNAILTTFPEQLKTLAGTSTDHKYKPEDDDQWAWLANLARRSHYDVGREGLSAETIFTCLSSELAEVADSEQTLKIELENKEKEITTLAASRDRYAREVEDGIAAYNKLVDECNHEVDKANRIIVADATYRKKKDQEIERLGETVKEERDKYQKREQNLVWRAEAAEKRAGERLQALREIEKTADNRNVAAVAEFHLDSFDEQVREAARKAARKEVDAIRSNLDQKAQEVNAARKEVNTIRSNLEEKAQEVNAAREEVGAVKTNLDEKAQEVNELNNKIEEMEGEHQQKICELQDIHAAKVAELRDTVERATSTDATKDGQIKTLSEELQAARSEVAYERLLYEQKREHKDAELRTLRGGFETLLWNITMQMIYGEDSTMGLWNVRQLKPLQERITFFISEQDSIAANVWRPTNGQTFRFADDICLAETDPTADARRNAPLPALLLDCLSGSDGGSLSQNMWLDTFIMDEIRKESRPLTDYHSTVLSCALACISQNVFNTQDEWVFTWNSCLVTEVCRRFDVRLAAFRSLAKHSQQDSFLVLAGRLRIKLLLRQTTDPISPEDIAEFVKSNNAQKSAEGMPENTTADDAVETLRQLYLDLDDGRFKHDVADRDGLLGLVMPEFLMAVCERNIVGTTVNDEWFVTSDDQDLVVVANAGVLHAWHRGASGWAFLESGLTVLSYSMVGGTAGWADTDPPRVVHFKAKGCIESLLLAFCYEAWNQRKRVLADAQDEQWERFMRRTKGGS